MAVTRYNLTGDVSNLIAAPFTNLTTGTARPVRVWIEANAQAIIDTAGNAVQLGTLEAAVATDGTFAFAGLVATTSVDVNPTGVQYRVWVNYPEEMTGKRAQWTSGWFDLTASADLADVVATAAIPPQWQADFIADNLIDAKGDLIVGTADNTPARKAAGANYTSLIADSAEADGLRWGSPSEARGFITDLDDADLGFEFAYGDATNLPDDFTHSLVETAATEIGLFQRATEYTTRRIAVRFYLTSSATWSGWTTPFTTSGFLLDLDDAPLGPSFAYSDATNVPATFGAVLVETISTLEGLFQSATDSVTNKIARRFYDDGAGTWNAWTVFAP